SRLRATPSLRRALRAAHLRRAAGGGGIRRRPSSARGQRMSDVLISGMHRAFARSAAAVLIALVAGCNFSGRPETEEAPQTPAPSVGEAVPAAGTPGPGTYSAFPGDTVYGVAQRFGVPVRTLIETNGLKPPYRLVGGQRLQVPVRQEHVVQAGDTLLAISRIYGVDQSSLVRENGLVPPYALKPGQRLTLPARIEAD